MPSSVHSRPAPNEDARELPLIAKCTALAGMLAYNTALGAAWAYYFLIGLASGLDEQATANALGASQVAAIMGSLAALAIGTQFGRLAPLVAGLSSGAASLTLLLGGASLALFAASASIFNFMWNLVLPYILASMSSYDRRGIMVPAAVAVQMVGLAIGPAAGALVVKPGAFDGAVWLSIVLIAVSAALFIAAALTHRTLLNARAQIA
jgi:MFS family permease